MKHRAYHDEEVRRYTERLETMSPMELAAEGVKHARDAMMVTTVMFLGLLGMAVWMDEPPWIIHILLIAIVLGYPFLVVDYIRNKRFIARHKQG